MDAADRLPDAQVAEMLSKLSKHFGEPVQPVSRYCAALRLWQGALHEKANRLRNAVALDSDTNGDAFDRWQKLKKQAPDRSDVAGAIHAEEYAHMVDRVFLDISKSNLLWRLIYGGESLRTEMCPVHQGKWSGCVWETLPCGCQSGANVTGWLPRGRDGRHGA